MKIEPRLQLGSAALVGPVVNELCDLYDRVFSAPPFHWQEGESGLHRQRLLRLQENTTFGAVLAWADGKLVGFAYGIGLTPDTAWWADMVQPLPAEIIEEWPGRTFLLFDFAVAPDCRDQGVGRRIHDCLLTSRPERRATLAVQPVAERTKAIYEAWGWRLVGQAEGGPGAAAPVFDVYVRDSLKDLREL